MKKQALTRVGLVFTACLILSGCGGALRSITEPTPNAPDLTPPERTQGSTIWDLFGNRDDPNVSVQVNKYLWNASLDVLNFMPVQSADPFSGVLVLGYGTPPGGSRAYRATVFVRDPALDARSLAVSLQSRSGPAAADTVRAIEDAIMTRARQLRIADSKL